MKLKYFISLICMSSVLISYAERQISYARTNQNVTFNIGWRANNYGNIKWQKSTDDGVSWVDLDGENKPILTVRATEPALYKIEIYGDPSCPPIIEEKELKLVSISADVLKSGSDFVELEVDASDLKDLDITEYGFTASLQGLNRTYSLLPRNKVGASPILDENNRFVLRCEGLTPSTSYNLRPYFKISDASIVFGGGKIASTSPGLKFDTEDWVIEKTSLKIPFSITDTSLSDESPEIWFGKDKNSLIQYNVESIGNGKYNSELIENLSPGEEYIAVIKATINGEDIEVEKVVKTWSDYSSVTIDETVTPVSHTVEWDNTNLICLTPETLQVEYPRMCRIDENKILLTYHGGETDHWQNSYLRKSYDNGKTWTDPVEIYNAGGNFLGSGFNRICNPEMTKLENGWIILTVVANANPETNQNCKVLATISKDSGETWSDPIIVGRGRTWEPQVIQMPNGELELLVSSEAYWWDNQRNNMYQEILSTRSTDNGETWTQYERASYKPAARDGMPVSVVMQGNKGVLFLEESVNGGIPPSLQYRTLDGKWDTQDWDGVQDDERWLTNLNSGAGAPHMIQLPTGEFLIMAHTNQSGQVWQTNRPQVVLADNTGHNFKYLKLPLAGNVLPSECGAYYNSFFLYDNDTVWLLFTKAQYKGQTRVESDVMLMEGKIVEK